MDSAAVQDGGLNVMHRRPSAQHCPTCSEVLAKHDIFACRAFEPTEAEIRANELLPLKHNRREFGSKTTESELDPMSEDDEDDEDEDDMGGFIVDDDVEDDDVVEVSRSPKKRAARLVILETDNEEDEGDVTEGRHSVPTVVRDPTPVPQPSSEADLFLRKGSQDFHHPRR